MKYSVFLSILLLLPALRAQAWEPTWGAEFNFVTASLLKGKITEGTARTRFADAIRANCVAKGRCKVEAVSDQYGFKFWRATYDDGWWFNIAADPGVVELQTKPSTLSELKAHQDILEADIFDVAYAAGFFVEQGYSNHVNMGLTSTFGQSDTELDLMRDFIVDYSNHPTLALGTFYDEDFAALYARPLALLSWRQRWRFGRIIRDVDRGKIKTKSEFVRRIHAEVYTGRSDADLEPKKTQAICLKTVDDDFYPIENKVMELRASPMLKTFAGFVQTVEVYHARLIYLKSRTKRVPFLNRFFSRRLGVGNSLAVRVAQFAEYLTAAGLDWKKYANSVTVGYLPEDIESLDGFLFEDSKKIAEKFRAEQKVLKDVYANGAPTAEVVECSKLLLGR